MRKSASFQIIIVLLLLCLAAPAIAAPDPVATVVAVRGMVVAKNTSGVGRTLAIKGPIFQDDVLKTDASGQLQIMFTDNSIISLGRESEMKIAEYRWQAGQKDGALKTQVKEGTFRVMGGALAKDAPQNFKTETPTATIGIRGSMYAFTSTQDTLSVVFQGGKGIEIFNDFGKISITVPGFGTQVVLNKPPEKPHRFTEQELKNLNKQLNGGNGQSSSSGGGSSSGSGGSSADSGGGSGDGGTTLADTLQPKPAPPPKPVTPYPIDFHPVLPPLPSPPSDGIYAFEGAISGSSTGSGLTEAFANGMSMGVNWYNKRIFGVAYDNTSEKENKVFFFGSVNGSTVTDLTILGGDTFGQNSDPGVISGNAYGVFAGAAYDIFAFNATGSTYLLKDVPPTIHDTWEAFGGGLQTPGAVTPVSPKGDNISWQGFAVGTSIDLLNLTGGNIGIYQTSAYDAETPNLLNLTVNKTTGTISGSLTPGWDIIGSVDDNIDGLVIGSNSDKTKSVYLRDDLMAALISSSGTVLQPQGNFMVVADPDDQFSDYFTWGYWEIAYIDSTNTRLIAAPYSFWIAGEPTPPAAVQNLITSSATGSYTGRAIGVEVTSSNVVTQLTSTLSGVTNPWGAANININFGSGAVSGSFNFDQVALHLSGGAVSSQGFSASLNHAPTGMWGTVNGGFYGPNANAVGGNFHAENDSSTHYLGIFGGNR